MPTITISTPIGGAFHVIIQRSDGTIAYEGDQTNVPFDPGITDPGTYTMYINNDGNNNGWCFTIPDCVCFLPSLVKIQAGEVRTGVFLFDIDPALFCPFFISLTYGTGGTFTSYPILISSLADLTLISPGVYKKVITLYADTTFLTYQIFRYHAGVSFDTDPCDISHTVYFTCIAPLIDTDDGLFSLIEDSGSYYIQFGFRVHCDDFNCEDFVLNYEQIAPTSATPLDVGTYSFLVDCSDYPAMTLMRFLVTPNFGTGGPGPIRYNLTLGNCCQPAAWSALLVCVGANMNDVTLELIEAAGIWTLRVTFADCGFLCHSFYGYANQTGTFTSGTGDGITIPVTPIDCSGSFPQSIDFAITPNLTPVGGIVTYNVFLPNCCSLGLSGYYLSANVSKPL